MRNGLSPSLNRSLTPASSRDVLVLKLPNNDNVDGSDDNDDGSVDNVNDNNDNDHVTDKNDNENDYIDKDSNNNQPCFQGFSPLRRRRMRKDPNIG